MWVGSEMSKSVSADTESSLSESWATHRHSLALQPKGPRESCDGSILRAEVRLVTSQHRCGRDICELLYRVSAVYSNVHDAWDNNQ